MVVISPLGPPEEGIRHTQPATTTYINQKTLGRGTLYISEDRVSWVGDSGHTFSLVYPHIALHAVSRDVAAFPHAACLYLIIDVRLEDSDETPTPNSTPDVSDSEEEDQGMTEIRFVPDDNGQLDSMFEAMSQCQALHPDPEDVDSDEALDGEEGDEEEYSDLAQGTGDATNGMFEDAEEDQDTMDHD